ncbi:hypothetical protein K474DRAFT_1712887 [Panus rudis PR-1116 ss-1]|nr:hypothetical protein K474DRAFT_1712887 [Panus rudis PR-1116 ss-1]
MSQQFVGPMRVEELLNKFIFCHLSARDAETIPEVDLTDVPHGIAVETEMYDAFCDALNNRGVCGTQYVLKNVSSMMRSRMGTDERTNAPDVMLLLKSLIKNGEIPEEAWAHCQVYLDLKPQSCSGAFSDDEGEPLESSSSTDGSETRTQLTDFAAALMSCQQRCFVFIIQICGKRARILRWGRSGCIVSESFDFHENPHHLAAFFYGYSKLNPEHQGHDPTAKFATAQQERLLREAINRFVQDSKMEVTVGAGENEFELIIRKPFFDARCACGHSTRVDAAFDPERRKLLCLKDSWRSMEGGNQSEKDIYSHLCASDIPHIAENIFIDDVKYIPRMSQETIANEPPEYVIQRTLTQELSAPAQDVPGWRKGCKPLREPVHCRLVQAPAFPLRLAKNSKEMVTAIRNAIECPYKAWDVKTYHRDVSPDSILIDPNSGGFLNDWDHAKNYSDNSIRRHTPFR